MIRIFCILLSCISLSHSEDSCPGTHSYGPYGARVMEVYLEIVLPNTTEAVKRKVAVPNNTTLLQGMLVAQRKDSPGEFRFETSYNEQYGHLITSINGFQNNHNNNNHYWIVYDAEKSLQCGVDSTYPENDERFIWRYEEYKENKPNEAASYGLFPYLYFFTASLSVMLHNN